MTLRRQQVHEHFAAIVVVVRDEDPQRPDGRRVEAASLAVVPGCACGSIGRRDGELAAGALAVAADLDRAAVQRDQVAHERQADAEAGARPLERHIALHEHVEDLRQHVSARCRRRYRECGSGPGPGRPRVLAARFRDQPDVPAVRRELAGVVQQVHQHLRQADRIAIERHGLVGQRNRQRVPRRVDPRAAQLHGRIDQVSPAPGVPCAVRPSLA